MVIPGIPIVQIETVIFYVAREMGVYPEDITKAGYQRDSVIATARQLVTLITYQHSVLGHQKIGKAFGCTHSFAAKARDKAISRLVEPEFCQLLVRVFHQLRIAREATFGTLPLARWPEGGREVYLEAWNKAGPMPD
jgi:hypothetical protein